MTWLHQPDFVWYLARRSGPVDGSSTWNCKHGLFVLLTLPLEVNPVHLSSAMGLSSTVWSSCLGAPLWDLLGGASAPLEWAACLRVGAVHSLPKKTCCQAGPLGGWCPGLGCSRSPYSKDTGSPTLEGVRRAWACVWCRWTGWPGCFYCSTPRNPLVTFLSVCCPSLSWPPVPPLAGPPRQDCHLLG